MRNTSEETERRSAFPTNWHSQWLLEFVTAHGACLLLLGCDFVLADGAAVSYYIAIYLSPRWG